MDTEDWLNSNLSLCELMVDSGIGTADCKMPTEVVFEVQSCPPLTYNQASILGSLGLYKHTLDEALKRDNQGSTACHWGNNSSVTAAMHTFAEALATDIVNSATYHSVGNIESEEIISPICYTEGGHPRASHCFFDPNANVLWRDDQECKTSSYTDEEKLAECLASMITQMALKEVTEHGGPRASVQESTFEPAFSKTCGPGMSASIRGLLSQSSLASNQSLDYPDAPPSTPLIPGTTQSRASFCRKLKGGLAKEFLPSPPPPTPNNNPDPSQHLLGDDQEMAEDTAKFVDRLMRSLSLECSEYADAADKFPEKRPWTDWSALSDYADQLSADIIKYVTTSDEEEDFIDRLACLSLSLECTEDTLVRFKENKGGPLNKICHDSALNEFADQLAADIIRSAITSYSSLEVPNKTEEMLQQSLLPLVENWVEEILEASYREMIDQQWTEINSLARLNPQSAKTEVFTLSDVGVEASIPSQTHRSASGVLLLQRTGNKEATGLGGLRELAEALLATAFIQALTELQSPILHPGSTPVGLGPPVHSSGSHRSSLQSSQRMQTSSSRGNTGQAPGAPLADDVADCAVDRYAEHLALEVIDGSLKLASKYLLGDGKTCSYWCDENSSWHSDDEITQRPTGPTVKALLDPQMCRAINELKGVLLWAATSQLGVQKLTLVVPDSQLRAQLNSVAHSTRLLGWTVGDLMTSLLQQCTHLSQAASRGGSLSDVYPLTCLQELIGELH